jgi:DinB family protein
MKKLLMSNNRQAINSRTDIIAGLTKNIDAFTQYISSLNKSQFESNPEDKWSPGQNLDHLIRSIKPLVFIYGLPKFMLKWMFGVANRPSKSFDALVEKYKLKLLAGGTASSRFLPQAVGFDEKEKLLRKYDNLKTSLVKKINHWQEMELDDYILPHPLLGKLTLREMLFFTIYHNEHHLLLLKQKLDKSD